MKKVLITGASSGIGRAAALHLANSGFEVFGTVRTVAAGEELEKHSAGKVTSALLDIADEDSVNQFCNDHFGLFEADGLFALVNNAGQYRLGPLELTPIEEWRKAFDVNFFGHVHLTQSLLPAIRKTRGRMVFVGSLAGRVAFPLGGPYCASKFALEGMVDSLRRELRDLGVSVSLIEPGTVETRMLGESDGVADAIINRASEPDMEHYRKLAAGAKQVVHDFQKMVSKPEKVVAAIHHAITSEKPRARYPVGLDCRSQLLLDALTTDKGMDSIILKMMAPKK